VNRAAALCSERSIVSATAARLAGVGSTTGAIAVGAALGPVGEAAMILSSQSSI
jgi:hypothetical protein